MLFKRIPLAAVASATALVALAALPLGASAQTRPALTRDVDRPSAQPVNATCLASAVAYPGFAKCVLYTVPPGKRLAVEMLSYKVVTDSNQGVVLITTGRNDPRAVNILFGLPQVYAVNFGGGVSVSGSRTYSGSQPMSFYLEENEGLAAQVDYTGGASYQQSFAFSGYLVDK